MDKSERKLEFLERIKEEAIRDRAKYEPMLLEIQKTLKPIAKSIAPATEAVKKFNEGFIPSMVIEEIERYKNFKNDRVSSANSEPIAISPREISFNKEEIREIISEILLTFKKEDRTTFENHKNRTSYPLPGDANVQKIKIKFIDGHTVKVCYPGLPIKKFDYKDMGFNDEKRQNPDTCWEFLRSIADNGGALTSNNFDKRFTRNVKYKTSQRLKKFFNIKTNPFYEYNEEDGYRPLFILLNEDDAHSFKG